MEAVSTFDKLERRIDDLGHTLMGWWVWPAFMLFVGLMVCVAAWAVYPGQGEQLMLFGHEFGHPCGFRVEYGVPCPQCGMTRSWVYTARGQLWTGLTYNAAGSTLFLWLAGSGVVGAARLLTRRPNLLAMPWWVLGVAAGFWAVVPYVGLWAARIVGFNPLP